LRQFEGEKLRMAKRKSAKVDSEANAGETSKPRTTTRCCSLSQRAKCTDIVCLIARDASFKWSFVSKRLSDFGIAFMTFLLDKGSPLIPDLTQSKTWVDLYRVSAGLPLLQRPCQPAWIPEALAFARAHFDSWSKDEMYKMNGYHPNFMNYIGEELGRSVANYCKYAALFDHVKEAVFTKYKLRFRSWARILAYFILAREEKPLEIKNRSFCAWAASGELSREPAEEAVQRGLQVLST